MGDDAVGWIGAGIFFVGLGLFEVVVAARLRPDHWIVRVQQPGGPLNLIFRDRGSRPPRGDDPIRSIRSCGYLFGALGAGLTLAGIIRSLL